MPVLDTTFLISGDRKAPEASAYLEGLVAEGEPLMLPAQVAIEYASGKQDPAEAMRKLREAYTFIPCGPDIALEAARLAQWARSKGLFPSWSDIQIAATARHEGMAIVTNNARHFQGLGIDVRTHP